MSERYVPRVLDRIVSESLTWSGGVLIEGVKACGKTATGRRHAASWLPIDTDVNVATAMEIDPSILLQGERPRLLDEWQLEPRLLDYVRRSIDASTEPGQFILTGSATPDDDAKRHTGAGRIRRLRMRPMSSHETGVSSAKVSLANLFDDVGVQPGLSSIDLDEWIEHLVRGGWPAALNLTGAQSRAFVRDYLATMAEHDVQRLTGQRRDPQGLRTLLASLGRNVATEANRATLLADVNLHTGMDAVTLDRYLAVLDEVMVTENLAAWRPHLRSKAQLRRSVKRYFVDPSLAVAATGGTPASLRKDLEYTGLLFESMVVRDLRVYAEGTGIQLSHYRDSNGLEVDVILEHPDGRWAACEIKLGEAAADIAASNLLKLASIVDSAHKGEPAFLAVITGRGVAGRRPDGVFQVPIGLLGP